MKKKDREKKTKSNKKKSKKEHTTLGQIIVLNVYTYIVLHTNTLQYHPNFISNLYYNIKYIIL